jgi:hypothetical protein
MMASPPLVPEIEAGGPLYFVLCDYGPKVGRAYVETDPDEADRKAIVQAIAAGEYTKVTQVLAVDVAAGTVRDATAEIMAEVDERLKVDTY